MKKRKWKKHFLSILICLTLIISHVFPVVSLAYASEGPPMEGGYSDPIIESDETGEGGGISEETTLTEQQDAVPDQPVNSSEGPPMEGGYSDPIIESDETGEDGGVPEETTLTEQQDAVPDQPVNSSEEPPLEGGCSDPIIESDETGEDGGVPEEITLIEQDAFLGQPVDSFVYTEETTPCLVTFYGNGGYFGESQTVTQAVYVLPEEKVSPPDPDPVRDAEGDTQYSFAGWYTAAAGGDEYDFNQAVPAALDLYAQWAAEINDGVTAWYLNDPGGADFTISDEAELRYLAELVNGTALDGVGDPISAVSFSGKTITLAGDITLTEEWTPIGTLTDCFAGAFDGNSHTISGLSITGSSDYQGLFGCTQNAEIKNLAVAGNIRGGSSVGGIAGFADGGKISNCINETEIMGTGSVGGIAGKIAGAVVQNCASLAPVSGTGELAAAGGIAGRGEGAAAISNCFSYFAGGGSLGGDGTTVTNSYYLAEENSEYGRTAEAFRYGEVAWLLEGGETEPHSNIWTQGAAYPVLGSGSVYRLALMQPETPCEQGTVTFAEPPADSNYKIYEGPEGQTYTYLPGGSSIELKVEINEGYEVYEPSFIPESAVTLSADGKYTATVNGGSVNLAYTFLLPLMRFSLAGEVDASSWYLNDPAAASFTISNEAELRYLAQLVNGTALDGDGSPLSAVNFLGKTVALAGDIALTGEWIPIGTGAAASFSGTFDGGTHTISGLAITGSSDYRGLFGYISSGTIQNVTVAGTVTGGSYVGGIAGYVDAGMFTNCVNNTAVTGTDSVGGIAGYLINEAFKTIAGCANNGPISGTDNAGGIAGYIITSSGTAFSNCVNNGDIAGRDNLGGIIGNDIQNTSIITASGCTNTGSITGANFIGGIVGAAYSITITACLNSGAIEGSGDAVGGFAGQNSYLVEKSSNAGTVKGQANVGGLVGKQTGNTVQNCRNLARVEGQTVVGSLVGQVEGTVNIINCFSYYADDSNSLCGGLATISNCYCLAAENSTQGRTADAFKYGEVAYLLDGGTGTHLKIWTQGADYPVLSDGSEASSYYRLILGQPAAPYALGTVTFAELPADSSYKIFDGPAGQNCTYLPSGTSLELNVQRAGGYDDYQLIFIPAAAVTETDGVYEVTISGGNINLEYKFLVPVAGNVAWYLEHTSPYTISNEAELLGLAQIVNGTAEGVSMDDFSGKIINLGDNITFTGEWTPIGNYAASTANQFKGNFDGQGHTIYYGLGSDLNPAGGDYKGLFGYTSNAVIQDLTVSCAVYITGSNIGGVAGYASGGELNNLTVSGTVSTTGTKVGGVAGATSNTSLSYCTAAGLTVRGGNSSTAHIGGIAGNVTGGSIANCQTDAATAIKGTPTNPTNNTRYLGGIVGSTTTGISYCVNRATVGESVTDPTNPTNLNYGYVGGITGSTTAGIAESQNYGAITGNTNVGGIAGYASLELPLRTEKFLNCRNEGDISGSVKIDQNNYLTGSGYIGGLVGQFSTKINFVFDNCENAGNVSASVAPDGTPGSYTGGIAGYSQNSATTANLATVALTFDHCDNTGAVAGGDYTGGVAGYTGISSYYTGEFENFVVTYCTNTGTIVGRDYTGGIAGDIKNAASSNIIDFNFCANGEEGTAKGSVTGRNYVGGLAGRNNHKIFFTDCANFAAVTSDYETATYVAGIVGGIYPTSSDLRLPDNFTRCVNKGAISGKQYTAGIAGGIRSDYRIFCVFESCYNQGPITGTDYTAGIIGLTGYNASNTTDTNRASMTRCFNEGTINGGGNYVGGLAGGAGRYSIVANCYNTGAVTSTSETATAVGGIVAQNLTATNFNSSETACFNLGAITVAGATVAGAIAGDAFTNNRGCYYLDTSIASPADAGYAFPRTAAEVQATEMADALNMATGANSGVWSWVDGAAYPIFADAEHDAICKITIEAGEHGTVTVSSTYGSPGSTIAYVSPGGTITPVITPEAGYILQDLTVTQDNGAVTSYAGHGISFTMPLADLTISAVFALIGSATAFPVTFDANGGYFGDPGDPQANVTVQVEAGEKVAAPATDPVRDTDSNTQYTFVGWYTDQAGTTAYNFNQAVVTDLTIYAKWFEVDAVTVNFDLNPTYPGFTIAAPAPEIAYRDHQIARPTFLDIGGATATVAYTYTFQGWYTAASGGSLFDFDHYTIPADYGNPITGFVHPSITLYAQWTATLNNVFDESGMLDDPYKIQDLTKLEAFRDSVNQGNSYEGKYFLLGDNIVLPAEVTWTPIGNLTYPFKGSFDGGGKTISGLNVDGGSADYQGLFGYVSGGAIENLTVNGHVSGSGSYVGGIAGYADADLAGCAFGLDGASSVNGRNYTAGLVGYTLADARFENCTNGAAVTGSGTNTAGIAGAVAATTSGGTAVFANCYNTGAVTGTGNYTAGIAGQISITGKINISSEFRDCANGAAITGSGNYTAGIAGGVAAGTSGAAVFASCYNTGDITGAGNYANGIAGQISAIGAFNDCHNSAAITGSGNYTAGIAGYCSSSAEDPTSFTNCYNTGTILNNGSNKNYTAGVLAQGAAANLVMSGCYNEGTVTGTGNYAGGVLGYGSGSNQQIRDCYNEGTVTNSGYGSYTGGVAGALGTTSSSGSYNLTGCYNEGTVTSAGSYTGGVAGLIAKTASVTGCHNEGAVQAAGNYAGGVFGYVNSDSSYQSTVQDCSNREAVSNAGNYTGGIAGTMAAYLTVKQCYNEGSVSAAVSSTTIIAGGLIGSLGSSPVIEDCYNTASVSGAVYSYSYAGTGTNVGGLMGNLGSSPIIKNCYNAASVSGFLYSDADGATYSKDGDNSVGQLLGYISTSPTISNCYYLDGSVFINGQPDADLTFDGIIAKPADSFTSSELAYLLDSGGTASRTTHWSQGTSGPVLSENSGNVYKIELAPSYDNGGVTLASASVYAKAGSAAALHITSAGGYILGSLTVKSGSVIVAAAGGRSAADCSFTMPASDVTVDAAFITEGSGTFQVTLHANGGAFADASTDKTVTAAYGDTVNGLGITPVRDGFDFTGWYLEADCVTAGGYAAVTADLELYAGWRSQVDVYLVTFDLNGPTAGTPPAPQSVSEGGKAVRPEDPVWEDTVAVRHAFSGWYTAKKGGTLWDFDTPLTGDLTLYAQWNLDLLGTGTAGSPLKINDQDVFNALSEGVNQDGNRYTGWYFELDGDITLDSGWAAIGDQGVTNKYFDGILDGRGHTITLDGCSDGFFSALGANAEISNVKISGTAAPDGDAMVNFGAIADKMSGGVLAACEATGLSIQVAGRGTMLASLGGLVGSASDVTITGCTLGPGSMITGTVNGYAGGLVGTFSPSSAVDEAFTDCANYGEIDVSAAAAGGIAGQYQAGQNKVITCANHGNVTCTTNFTGQGGYAGGIMGFLTYISAGSSGCTFTDCTNDGEITGASAGGILGGQTTGSTGSSTTPVTFNNCENEGKVSGTAGAAGGILAGLGPDNFSCVASDCRNSGEITAYRYGGGIAGFLTRGSLPLYISIENCSNTGQVTVAALPDSYAGGIVGYSTRNNLPNGKIYAMSRCWNTGDITAGGSGTAAAGGIAGYWKAPLDRCWSGGSITGGGAAGGLVGYLMATCSDTISSNGTITNSYWFGDTLPAAPAAGGVVGVIEDDTNPLTPRPDTEPVIARCYYGIPAAEEAPLPELDGVTWQSQADFTNGKVVWLLEQRGESEPRTYDWVQDPGRPVLNPTLDASGAGQKGDRSVYKVIAQTNSHSQVATVTVIGSFGQATLPGVVIQGPSMAVLYSQPGDGVGVAVTEGSETVTEGEETCEYTYTLESLTVTQDDTTTDIEGDSFLLTADAVVMATFIVEKTVIEVIEPPVEPPKEEDDDDSGSDTSDDTGSGGGTGTGAGKGEGPGTGPGAGPGIGEGKGPGTGPGSGPGTGTDTAAGAGGAGADTTTAAVVVPGESTVSSPSVAAVINAPTAEISEVEEGSESQSTEEMKDDGGGGGGGGGLAPLDEEDRNPAVFEIVKKVVQENPSLSAIILLAILAIVGFGGLGRYRRYKKDV